MTIRSGRASGPYILAVVCCVAFFGVLNASAVVVVLPQMGHDLAVDAGLLGWVMSLFLLTYGVAIPFYGRMADRYGARRLYLFGLALFGVGSACCAWAPDIGTMLAARVVQALGGAAFPGLGMTLASRAFPASRRGVALGVIAATMGVGSAVGPLAGGLVAELLSWRYLFGISAMATLIIPLAHAVLPQESVDGDASLDLPGGGLLAVGISGALFAVAQGGRVGWTDPLVLAAAIIAIISLLALVRHQARVPEPFLPRALVGNGPYRRIVLMGFCTTGTYLAALVGLPLLLTPIHDLSTFEVGLVLLPGALTTAVMGVLAGRIVDRHGPALPTFIGAVLMAAAMLGLSIDAGRSVPVNSALAAVLGAGMSLLNTPLAATITKIVQPKVFASALSLNTMVFFTGGSVGTTVLVTLVGLRQGAAQAWNPLDTGGSVAFSDALLVFVLPMLLCAALATTLGRSADG